MEDPSQFDEAMVSIYPIGKIIILPAYPTVPLSGSRLFAAFMEVPAVGLFPLNDVTWRINGVTGGNRDMGAINPNGLYIAPQRFPPGVPLGIQVEATFNPVQAAVANTSLVLERLEATPFLIREFQVDKTVQLTVIP